MRGYLPKEGQAWNPLDKYPPNDPCPCGSGSKWKKCCRQKTHLIVSKEEARTLEIAMKQIMKGRKKNG